MAVAFPEDTRTELERKAAQLKGVALFETGTYVVLFLSFAVFQNQIATSVTGFVHGWIVIAFAVMVVWITPGMRWPWWFPVLAIVTGPFGGIIVHEKIRRHGAPDRTRTPPAEA